MLAKDVLTEEWLADVLQDSMEMDWTTTDGARAIMRALERGLVELPQGGGQVSDAILAKLQPSDRAEVERGVGAHATIIDGEMYCYWTCPEDDNAIQPLIMDLDVAREFAGEMIAALADQREAVSEGGWVRVPVEPTEVMMDAYASVANYSSDEHLKRGWSAMLAAAASVEDKS